MSDSSPITIDCDTCTMQHTPVCEDCVVTFVCSRQPDEAVIIDLAELRAVRMLGDVGLVPELRYTEVAGDTS